MRLRLPALTMAALTALSTLPAWALDADARLRLAGEFIGAHARIYIIGKRCNYTVDQLYGPEIALKQLAPLLSADENDTLDAYLGSTEFTQSLAVIENDIDTGWRTLSADQGNSQGKSKAQVCAALIERAIQNHRDVNARLKALH